MKELINISLCLIFFLPLSCQNKKDDIKFIKNKELIKKIDETILFIETTGIKYDYLSIKLLKNRNGDEYIRIQTELNINNVKTLYQERYKGKLIFVNQASDTLLNKYFDQKYKHISQKHNSDKELFNYENIGYILRVHQKNIICIEGIIGKEVPEEISKYKNLENMPTELMPPKLSK